LGVAGKGCHFVCWVTIVVINCVPNIIGGARC
jgi:hypothetical protein